MSNLTDLLPAGAGGKQVSFVASGTIGNGVTVALNSDGTVSPAESNFSNSVVFESADITGVGSAYDTNTNKIVVAYKDGGNSNYGTAVVGTVSGASISFGTPVVFESASSVNISVVFDSSNNKIVISYTDAGNGYYLTAIIGTVSGTAISFGTATVVASEFSQSTTSAFDSNSNKVVFTWAQLLASNNGRAVVGTVSGTSISFGTAVDTASGVNALFRGIVFDSTNNKIIITYRDNGNSNYGTAVVGTVSGTSISFGSPTAYSSASVGNTCVSFDVNAGKVVIVYQDSSNSNSGLGIVGTVSGTSISFGSATSFNSIASTFTVNGATFDSNANKCIFVYRTANGHELVEATVSGTSVSFSEPNNFDSINDGNFSVTYDPDENKTVIPYRDTANSNYGTVRLYDATKSGTANFIGISDAAISDTATGSVTIKGGISTNVTGLTPNALYYVQDDGSLVSGFIPYDISGATTTTAFAISQDTVPTGIAFNTSGSKMFVCGRTNSSVFQYSLSSAFDVSSASYDSVNFSFSAQQTTAAGMAFNANGTSMYVLSYAAATVYQYTLSSGFDLTTASYASKSFSVSSQEGEPHGIAFNTSGTKLYIVGVNNDTVYQYSLSSAFDVSTASYDSVSFSIGSQEAIPLGLTFGDSGNKMYVIGTNGDDINEYSLSTPFDISTSVFTLSFSVAGEESDPRQMVFSTDGTKMFVVGSGSDEVNEYSTTAASTTVLAGKALSSTSINLDYTT